MKISDQSNKELTKLVEEFMIWGGYPRVVLSKSVEEKKVVLANIFSTYFLREVRDVLGLIDDFRLANLIQILALQSGQLIEYNSLSKSTSYDLVTLKKYINVLEKTFILANIKPFFRNKQKEIVKNPKIYFLDNGLKNHVIKNFNRLSDRTDRGFVEENFIFSECLKKGLKINYWRTKTQMEIDFVVETLNGMVLPMESKTTLSADQAPLSIVTFCQKYDIENTIIFNTNLAASRMISKNKIFFLPFWAI